MSENKKEEKALQAKRQEIQRIRQHLWPELNDSQFQIAIRRLSNLRSRGIEIDPFDQLVIPVVYKKGKPDEKLVFIYTRDFHMTVLRSIPGYRGHRSHVIHENDEYIMSSEMELPSHSWSQKDRGDVVGAWSVIYVEGMERPFFKEIKFSEYAKKGESDFLWKQGPSFMIEKCALVANGREVDVSCFGNAYVEGELPMKNGMIIEPDAIPEKTEPPAPPKKKKEKDEKFGGKVTDEMRLELNEKMKAHFGGDEEVEQFLMKQTGGRISSTSGISEIEYWGIASAFDEELKKEEK